MIEETYKGHALSYLESLLSYGPESGHFTWRVTRGSRAPQGGRAGTHDFKGYRRINIEGKLLYEHRLAWLFVYGKLPAEIDHANLDKVDNRIANLRSATRVQNAANQAARGWLNTKGVHLCHYTGRYRAQIRTGGKRYHLGRFDTPEEANAAYAKAALELFGEFACA